MILIDESKMSSLDIKLKKLSQQKITSILNKGLDGDIGNMAISLWHYVNPAMVLSTGGIYKTQSSMKLMDELWFRVGSNLEKSEHLTDKGLKILKRNFYSLSKIFEDIYQWNSKEKRWEIY
jgi:hypothetical protein